MVREEIAKLVEKSLEGLKKEVPSGSVFPKVEVERATEDNYGDYSSGISMALSRILKKNPAEIAEALKIKIEKEKKDFLGRIEVVNGFLNFFLSDSFLKSQVEKIIKEKEGFGGINLGKKERVNIEFISANPTGPLTLGNGRGGFCGDVLANVLERASFKVEREYYINDAGEQVNKLGHSVLGDEEAVYKGPYIEELKKKIREKDLDKVGKEAAIEILDGMIKPSVKKMGIVFDTWFKESDLYKEKKVEKALDFLKKKDLTSEAEGALWFKSTKFGDDKDRVLIKADGDKTYLASDIAYLKNKFERGFKKLIFFWGADHYGYINRLKGAAEALGYKKDDIEVIIMQLVRLMQGGQEVKMSKRSGIYVTIDELIDEVGLDVARFFFLMRGNDSHLVFDLDLAKEQSDKNPVYYVQYAYVRICSIINAVLAGGKISLKKKSSNLDLLSQSAEISLIKKLMQFPEIVEDTAKDYQLQRLPQYAMDLSSCFHHFYQECRVISDNIELSQARLSLVLATKIVLKNTFDSMGISAPEKM